MPLRVLIIDGYPDPDRARFCHALADAYATGAEGAGHAVDRLTLAEMDLPLLRTAEDGTALRLRRSSDARRRLAARNIWSLSIPCGSALFQRFSRDSLSRSFGLVSRSAAIHVIPG